MLRVATILQRYVLRELALRWLLMFLGLMVIMTVGQLPQILTRAAEHELATHLVFEVLVLMSVANMPVVILLTLLLAIVVTIGQLSHDSELTAMRAGGFSPLNLFRIVAVFAIPLVALLGAVTHEFAPRAYCSAVLARADAARNLLLSGIRPGVFMPLGDRGTLLASEVSADGEMRNVFVSADEAEVTRVLTAARGRIRADRNADTFSLALYDGEVHEGVTGERRFKVVKFHELTRPIVFPGDSKSCVRPDTRSTAELWRPSNSGEIAELNLRFGQVALAIAFVLLSVPLAITPPRKGAFSRVPLAMGTFAIATFCTFGISSWSARNPVTGTAVFWSVLGGAIIAGLAWLLKIQGPRIRRH